MNMPRSADRHQTLITHATASRAARAQDARSTTGRSNTMIKPQFTLLLCDDDAHELAQLRHDLRLITGATVYSAANGIDAALAITRHQPDIAFIDLVLPGMDALGVMRYLSDTHPPHMPRIIIMIEPGQQAAARQAMTLGACMVVEKRELTRERLPAILRRAQAAQQPLPPDAEARLHKLLLELGMPRHLDGFNYITQAVLLALSEPYLLDNFSKYLYPAVARRYNTTTGCVERSIRHAIEAAWAHIALDVLQREFGNTIDSDRGKPTNAEFIARIADKLRHGGEYLPGGD